MTTNKEEKRPDNDDILSVEEMADILKKASSEKEPKDTKKISRMNTFDAYIAMRNGEITNMDKIYFIRRLVSEYYDFVVRKKKGGEMQLFNDIQKAFLIFRRDEDMAAYLETYSAANVSYMITGKNLFNAYIYILMNKGDFKEVTYNDTGKVKVETEKLVGDVAVAVSNYKRMFSNHTKAIDIYDKEQIAKKGIISALIALFFALPTGKILHSIPWFGNLIEPLLFIAAVESAIKGKLKGCLTYVAFITAIFVYSFDHPQTDPLLFFAAFFGIRAAIYFGKSLPDIMRYKSKSSEEFYKSKDSYLRTLDALIEALWDIRNECYELTEDESDRDVIHAHFDLSLSEFIKLKRMIEK